MYIGAACVACAAQHAASRYKLSDIACYNIGYKYLRVSCGTCAEIASPCEEMARMRSTREISSRGDSLRKGIAEMSAPFHRNTPALTLKSVINHR